MYKQGYYSLITFVAQAACKRLEQVSGSGSGNPRSPETLLELSEARVPGRETQASRLDGAGADFRSLTIRFKARLNLG